jgi:O-acetyl-ADP-ribose deacetylase (regulator of RNase III)
VRHGDITEEEVDAIVNNANSQLINDDGLAFNIAQRGGPKINIECENIMLKFGNPIPTGNVVATSGGDMICKKVIHAVGPIYSKKGFECPLLLKRTIGNSLRLANLMKMESIAFPALCTGLYRFPTSIVTRLLFDEILHFNRHDKKRILKDIRLIDISEARSKIMAKEFDNRDFTQGG